MTIITFRPLNIETDTAEMARLYGYAASEPISEATARDWWTLRRDEIRITTLAIDEKGEAVGYSDVDRETWMKPGHFWIKIVVAPHARNRGLGTQMYNDALQTWTPLVRTAAIRPRVTETSRRPNENPTVMIS